MDENKSNELHKELDLLDIDTEVEDTELISQEEKKPLDEKLYSSIWKVRKNAYHTIRNELEIYSNPNNTNSPNSQNEIEDYLTKYKSNYAKILEDSNPLSLEIGLDLIIYTFDNFSDYIKSDETLLNAVFKNAIEKSYACSKTPVKIKSKELVYKILEKSNNIQSQLEILISILILSPKKVKTVIYGLQILQYIISEFGTDNIDFKFFMPSLIKLIEGTNHGTRYETYELIKEIYRWARWKVIPFVKEIKEVYFKEIKNHFDKIDENQPDVPKSTKKLNTGIGINVIIENKNSDLTNININDKKESPPSEINKEEYFTTPVNQSKNFIQFLKVYNDDWVSNLLSKERKWVDKKDLLDELARNTINNSYIINNTIDQSYDNLFSSFKILLKDSNVNVVHSTLTVINALSTTLGNKFSSYAKEYVPLIFEKFKEKKDKLNKEIINTLSSFLKCNFSLDEIVPMVKCVSNDKSNQFKLNICEFLFISIGKTYSHVLKNIAEDIISLFVKLSEEVNPEVRSTANNCLALLKVRLNDFISINDLFKEISESKKNKIEELGRNINYDKLYDLVPIIEKAENGSRIKINRRKYSIDEAMFEFKESNEKEKANINNNINIIVNGKDEKDVKERDIPSNIKNDLEKKDVKETNSNLEKDKENNIIVKRNKENSKINENVINIDDLPITGIKGINNTNSNLISANTNENLTEETLNSTLMTPYGINQQQSDLDDFTRKLEEAMRKESEKGEVATENRKLIVKKVVKPVQNINSSSNNNIINYNNNQNPATLKATKEVNDDDDEAGKLNKTEVDNKINSLIGEDISNLLQSSKWDEKKNGLVMLNDWINEKVTQDSSLISNNLESLVVFMRIKLKDYKESNFNVIREACSVYINLISNFTGKGFDKRLCTMLIKGFFDKIGETRLKEHISNLFSIMMENIGPKFVINNILKLCNNEKKVPSNAILISYANLLEKSTDDFGINFIPVKEVVDYSKMLAANTNPQVRTSSTTLLCGLYKYIGKDLKVLLKDIKESTLKVIETELDKVKLLKEGEAGEAVNAVAIAPLRQLKPYALKEEGPNIINNKTKNNSKNNPNEKTNTVSIIDSLIPYADISKKITPKILKDINTGKWPEKKEAGETIEKILNEANMKILPNGLIELFTVFKARLSDGNKNVVRLIVNLISKIIDAVGPGFKSFTKIISTPLLTNLSDKMQMLREDVLICMEKWVFNAGFDSIILYIPVLLKVDNFEMRADILKFLFKHKDSFVFIKDKYDLKEFVSPLLICLQDKSLTIRNSSEELISYLLRFVPLSNFLNSLKDFKTAIANTLKEILNKYRNEENLYEISSSHSTTLTLKHGKSGEIKHKSDSLSLTPIKKGKDKSVDKSIDKAKSQSNMITEDATIKVIKKPKNNVSENNLFATNRNGNGTGTGNGTGIKDELASSNSTTIKDTGFKILSTTNSKNRNTMGVTTISNKKMLISSTSIFQATPSFKISKEKRLEIDKKYKFNLDTLNDDFVNKLKDSLKLLFTVEFVDKLFHDDIKFSIEGLTLIHNYFRESIEKVDHSTNTNFKIFDYLDLILKWIGWRSNNNQNPLLVKVLLEYLETLSEKITQAEYELTEIEGYIIITILIDKLGINSKLRESARSLIGKFTVVNKFSHLVNISLNTGKNSKVKTECMEICSGLIAECGVSIASNKDLKSIAKMLFVNDNLLKNSVISLFSEIYIQIKDNLWNILNDLPDKIKQMLYNKFYNAGLVNDEDENEEESDREVNSKEDLNLGNNYMNTNANLITNTNININNNDNKTNRETQVKDTPNNVKFRSDDKIINLKVSNASNVNGSTSDLNTHSISKDERVSHSNIANNFTVSDSKDLNTILNHLNQGEISERVNVILIIHELIFTKFTQSKSILIPNIDNIIRAFVTSLINLFKNKTLQEIPIKLGKYLLTVLYKISSNKELIQNISYDVLLDLTEEVLSNLLIENLDKVGDNQEGVIIIRSLNSTMLRVLENCNYTHVITVLLQLVMKYRKNEMKIKISGLAIKCLLKINQILPQIIDSIQVDKILNKIYELLCDFDETNPSLVTNNQTDQMVIRYIKNLINELVKLRKDAIKLDYLKGVDRPEVKDKYLKRWITNILASLPCNAGNSFNELNNLDNNENRDLIMNTNSNVNLITSQSCAKDSHRDDNDIESLIAYKNKLQQTNANSKSAITDRLNKGNTSMTSTSSPSKRPRNTEMYNKIINLKSKLANYNNSTNIINKNDDKNMLSRTFIETGNENIILPTLQSHEAHDLSRPIMTKINELKKKWNDVSSRTRGDNLTPDKYKGNTNIIAKK